MKSEHYTKSKFTLYFLVFLGVFCTNQSVGQATMDVKVSGSYVDFNNNGKVDAGDAISYVFTVTNTSSSNNNPYTLNNIHLTGSTPVVVVSGNTGSLAQGSSSTALQARYMLTQSDIDNGGVYFQATFAADWTRSSGSRNGSITQTTKADHPLSSSDPNYNTSCPDCAFNLLFSGNACRTTIAGTGFDWNYSSHASPVTYSYTETGQGEGFILDIYKLDNSFNVNINNVSLGSKEIEFQTTGTPGKDIRFTDGSMWESGGVPAIYTMTGTATHPVLRVIISPEGIVSMYGSKSSGGPLLPLEPFNGLYFNQISWNSSSVNNITVTQTVVGPTVINAQGFSFNRVPCPVISGNVFEDKNKNTIKDPGENGTTANTNLHVYLINEEGIITGSAQVANDGTYSIVGNVDQEYALYLSSSTYPIGTDTTVTQINRTLPTDWINTGENGDNNTGSGDGLANGILHIVVGLSDMENQNFGIGDVNTLPIGLSFFNAGKISDEASLTWATASEQNNAGFEIMRSSDGSNWQGIGFVPTKATNGSSSATIKYSFTDGAPATGVNYYRLKQIDLDGSYSLSDIRALTFDRAPEIGIFPNPVGNTTTLRGLSGNETIQLSDVSGRVISSMKATSDRLNIDFSGLPAGVYHLRVISEGGRTSKVLPVVKGRE